MSWGVELWDKYDELVSHGVSAMDFMDNSLGFFLRERGKIEGDYVSKLRKLVNKCMPVDSSKNNESELSHIKAYKQMLKEIKFTANQHEIMAENYSRDEYKNVIENVKNMKEKRKRLMKEGDKIASELKRAFKVMNSYKEKFRKAYEDQQKAAVNFTRAENDGNVPRNDVEKLRTILNTQTQNCEIMNGQYASQLIKTNDYQREYYGKLLPGILNGFQNLEKERIDLLANTLRNVLNKEKEVNPIIMGCLDSSLSALSDIDTQKDTELIIEVYKSGDVPPGDFKFNDMTSPLEMLNRDVVDKATNYNLYPLKKKLEQELCLRENHHRTWQKELLSLQTMIESYNKTPKFGDSKQFMAEMASIRLKIQENENALIGLNEQLTEVEDKLLCLKSRTPQSGSPLLLQREDRSNSSGSLKSSSLSLCSNTLLSSTMNISPDHSAPELESNPYGDEEDDEEEGEKEEYPTCRALYAYDGDLSGDPESTIIPMLENELFMIIESDCNGWTLVRRFPNSHHKLRNQRNEGFVPSSFIYKL